MREGLVVEHQRIVGFAEPAKMDERRCSVALTALFAAVVAAAVYVPSLGGEFVMDDQAAIVKNDDLRPTTPWQNLFQNDYWGTPIGSEASHKSYRPLTVLTFRLNYMMHGLHTFGYHVLNVVFYSLSVFLAHFVISDLLKSSAEEAGVCALLFALHPVHTESVSSVVGRAEVLCACAFFSTYLAHKFFVLKPALQQQHCRAIFGLVLVFIFAFLSMLFKEVGLTVLGLIVLTDFCSVAFPIDSQSEMQVKDSSNHKVSSNMRQGSTICFFVVRFLLSVGFFITCLVFRVRMCDTNFSPTFSDVDNYIHYAPTNLSRRLSYSYLHFRYAWLLIFPMHLSCDWSYEAFPLIESITDFRLVLPAILYLTILSLCVHSYMKCKRTIFIAVLGLVIGPFLPSSNIFFPVATVIGERLLFLPSLGFCILATRGLYALVKSRLFRMAILGVICSLYAGKTMNRNAEWSTAVELFKSAVSVVPRSCKAHVCVAAALNDLNTYEARVEALSYINSSLQIKPDYAGAHYMHGVILRELGKLQDSARAFKLTVHHSHAVEYKPDVLYLGLANLGALYLKLEPNDVSWAGHNYLSHAYDALVEANSLEPKRYAPIANLAEVCSKLGKLDEAMTWYASASHHKDVDANVLNNFAIATYKLAVREDPDTNGMSAIDEVAALYREALKIDKRHANANKNLGKIYYRKKEFSKAAKHFRRCRKASPRDGGCIYDLAKSYMRLGKWHKSITLMERLVRSDGDSMDQKLDLSSVNIQQAKKNLETARKVVEKV